MAVAGIGVRLKGNGSFQPIDQKPSFKPDLNEYADLEIDGLDDLVLNNLVSDPSVDPSDGRIRMLPHGGDETFREPDRPVDYVYGLLATACLADPGCEDLWGQATWDAVAAADALDLDDRALDWLVALDPLLAADTRVPWTWSAHEADVDDLVTFIVWRDTELEQMPGMPPKR